MKEVAPNWKNKTRVSKETGKGKEQAEKQSREYWNLILYNNTGRRQQQLPEYWKLVYRNIILEYNAWYYWTIITKYWNTGRQLE